MGNRELFSNIMLYKDFDRMPLLHWGGWPETRQRWIKEGLDANIPENVSFGISSFTWGIGPELSLYPPFEEIVYEETEDWKISRLRDGSISKTYKHQSSLPGHIGYTLDSKGQYWDEYKKRLQPHPDRRAVCYFYAAGWAYSKPHQPSPYPLPDSYEDFCSMSFSVDAPVAVGTGSLFGWLRDWMGVEELTYLAYDDPGLLREMIETIADLVVHEIRQVLPHVRADLGFGWEDVCCKNGPLITKNMMKEFGAPAYNRISEALQENGIRLYLVDCDGVIDSLVPYWLEAGVNVMFPLEVGSWNADPRTLRNKFGKKLRIYGGINKREIALGKEAIDREIALREPLMAEGGFVPLPDHRLPPDVSLDNYKYYVDRLASLRF
jgi:hypothetical protein